MRKFSAPLEIHSERVVVGRNVLHVVTLRSFGEPSQASTLSERCRFELGRPVVGWSKHVWSLEEAAV